MKRPEEHVVGVKLRVPARGTSIAVRSTTKPNAIRPAAVRLQAIRVRSAANSTLGSSRLLMAAC